VLLHRIRSRPAGAFTINEPFAPCRPCVCGKVLNKLLRARPTGASGGPHGRALSMDADQHWGSGRIAGRPAEAALKGTLAAGRRQPCPLAQTKIPR
jgi:hypothetical protein